MSGLTSTSTIVQRVWSYCNVLRDAGVSYGDYIEQLTYLLFLKMADEAVHLLDKANPIPQGYDWASLRRLEGSELESHYIATLVRLGTGTGLVADIYRQSQNKIGDPAKLTRLVQLVDGETWTGLGIDVKGAIYEGLLEKNAQDTRSGAGQYFTPRPLISAMVDVMRPQPGETICDPACGTGGFLLIAYDYIIDHFSPLDHDQADFLRTEALRGFEIVPNTARLGLMNLYLHGIGSTSDQSPIIVGDSLISDPGMRFDMVLTNPPFGKKSSDTYTTDAGDLRRESQPILRDDFWTSTSNKQLNFIQHIKTILKINGRAAVVIPDNVLFEGGAGETVRRKLLHDYDVHTLLRLPTGIFYSQGVKANVIFFDRRPASPNAHTHELWIYDLRTNQNFTLKQNPLATADLEEFVTLYNPDNRHQRTATYNDENLEGRWRSYGYSELLARDKVNLDIFWLRDESVEDSANLPHPDLLAQEILDDLQAALAQFQELLPSIEVEGGV